MNDAVRPATPDDAEGVAGIHRATWLETYAHLVPSADIEARFANREARVARWRELLAEPRAAVAERDGAIVGWATASAGRGDAPPRPLELEGIYLLAAAHGSGLGQSMLDAVLGDAPAFLWVADGNPRAEAFYRRNGFVRDGATEQHPVGGAALVAVRMVR